ncbi:hypothetical protein B296_00019062 [Ensete ventricosum]|uniref:Uncharacterized protein n=1 Tax=Ensete ventricosum TaxID=4639 RepID=A0A426XR68_ENSVE|nr:hypothetical protein B296_00019062 [Ensete ventricosum]
MPAGGCRNRLCPRAGIQPPPCWEPWPQSAWPWVATLAKGLAMAGHPIKGLAMAGRPSSLRSLQKYSKNA